VIARVWYDDDALARAARLALAPLSLIYRAASAARGAMFDAGLAPAHRTAIPAISIGNLTVGGTGKTPVSAWIAGALRTRGARPGIVLRGYGDDEPKVHAVLNPDVPVIVEPDRVAGVAAAARQGCDLAVLDDAFQHRRAHRVLDIVLLAADRWPTNPRALPAGPFRELPPALARASHAFVTRKAADAATAERVASIAARFVPGARIAILALVPDALHAWSGDEALPLDVLGGARVLAISAIGDPRAFRRQLESLGASVVEAAFPDHHAFTSHEAETLARRAEGYDLVVCTLKDAVKLGPLWPRVAPACRYLSQGVRAERGREAVDHLLDAALTARASTSQHSAG
jgi:tetraacyldisaccharide 4'-kinase